MYFLRGSLPWQGLKAATNKQKYEKIGEKKQTTAVKDLCGGFPGNFEIIKLHVLAFFFDRYKLFVLVEEFGIYLQYVRKLGFEETPDYDFLRELFDKILERQNEQDDGVYDWVLLNEGKGWEVNFTTTIKSKRRSLIHCFKHFRIDSNN